jgi:membrane protein
MTTRAAAIAFRVFVSIFPAIIVLLSLIPVIPIDDFQESLFENIRAFFPGDTFSLVESTLDDLINKTHHTLISLGFVLALYFASNTVHAILLGFNESYHLEKKHKPLIIRVYSLVLLVVLTILIVLAVGLITFSEIIFHYLQEFQIVNDAFILLLLKIAQWLIITLLLYTSITVLYNAGDLNRKKWQYLTAGASLATTFFIAGSLGFAWFVQNFSSYNKLYGSLGTLLVLLVWINFNSFIILMGFELNTSINKAVKKINVIEENV